jgi:hypothetical protein
VFCSRFVGSVGKMLWSLWMSMCWVSIIVLYIFFVYGFRCVT